MSFPCELQIIHDEVRPVHPCEPWNDGAKEDPSAHLVTKSVFHHWWNQVLPKHASESNETSKNISCSLNLFLFITVLTSFPCSCLQSNFFWYYVYLLKILRPVAALHEVLTQTPWGAWDSVSAPKGFRGKMRPTLNNWGIK